MQYNIDFSEPYWIVSCYHVTGIISIFLNSLGIYLLIFQCEKLGTFRFYLLAYLCMCFLTDIDFTFLMQCVPLFPFLAGHAVGILTEWFGVSLHYNVVSFRQTDIFKLISDSQIIASSIVSLQFESLTLSFIKKHQAIAIILKTHIVPNFLLFYFYFCCLITPLLVTVCVNVVYEQKDEQFSYIAEFYPEYLPNFQKLPHFDLYIKNSTYFFIVAIVITFLSLVCSLLALIIMDLFRLMRVLKLQISSGTFKKHQDAIRSLIVQATTTILCVSPVSLVVAFIVLEFRYAQFVGSICLVLFTAHSSINIISLFLFFPPFREYASKKMTFLRFSTCLKLGRKKLPNPIDFPDSKTKKPKTTTPPMPRDYYIYQDHYEYGSVETTTEPFWKDYYFDPGYDYITDKFQEDNTIFNGVVETIKFIYDISSFISFFVNIFHLIALTRKELRTQLVYIIMIGISLCDIFQSFGNITQVVMMWNIIYKIEGCWGGVMYSHLIINLLSKSIQIMSRRCSAFFALFIAVIRAFSVLFPLNNLIAKMLKPKFGTIVMLLISICCATWSSYYFYNKKFEKVKYCEYDSKTPPYIPYHLVAVEKWERKYLAIDGFMAMFISCTYFFIAIILLVAVNKATERRKKLRSDASSNTFWLVLVMTISVFISEIIYGVYYVTDYFYVQYYKEQEVYQELDAFSYTLLIANSVTHCLICFLMSSQYRGVAKRLVRRKRKRINDGLVFVVRSTIH
ncbi:hypothetical protein CRE_12954 [Caenorhabditis remanei]|uniref:G-protein coupled receptors family 1 profile domain-containing protein n=1 Tax=Caenorhabditis remanei TaxID=31234 RepID=E3N0Y7_CAERE|nr:hypothetical protein CRE_12954 [Caenorhabditis remanei]